MWTWPREAAARLLVSKLRVGGGWCRGMRIDSDKMVDEKIYKCFEFLTYQKPPQQSSPSPQEKSPSQSPR